MAFYYVKTGGTATGDAGRYASKQTGSFAGLGAANYYATITAALAATTAPVAGDYIVCSHLYDFDNGSGQIGNTFPTGAGVTCMSVDDTAIDSYLAGAKEQTNGIILNIGTVKYVGFIHDTGNAISVSSNSHTTYENCTLELTTRS